MQHGPLKEGIWGGATEVRRGRRVTFVLLFAFLIVFAVWLTASRQADVHLLISLARSMSPATLGVVIALAIGNYILRAARWQFFCRRLGVEIGFCSSVEQYVAGFAFGVTPARIGETVRIQFLRVGYGVPYYRGASIAVADRLHDLIALVLLILGASVVSSQASSLMLVLIVIAVVSVIILLRRPVWLMSLVDFSYWLTGRVSRLHAALRRSFRIGAALYATQAMLGSLILGIIAWLFECLGFFIILAALEASIALPVATLIYASATLFGALSFLPGGLGGFEAVALVGLTQAGVEMPTAVIAVAVIRIFTLWLSVALGWLVLGRMMLKRRARMRRNGSADS